MHQSQEKADCELYLPQSIWIWIKCLMLNASLLYCYMEIFA